MQAFYKRLLKCLNSPALRDGDWQLFECASVAEGNESWDGFIAWAWQGQDGERLLVVVNYAPQTGTVLRSLSFDDLRGGRYRLSDVMGPASFDPEGDTLLTPGLYLDLAPWGYHWLELQESP